MPIKDQKILAGYTRQVLANLPAPRAAEQLSKDQSDVLAGAFGRIKHVIYVINENLARFVFPCYRTLSKGATAWKPIRTNCES